MIKLDLYKEILSSILENEEMQITFTNLKISPREIIELECYKALKQIKAIIEDDSLEDAECFIKIEETVRLFESLGSDGGARHDFG